MIMYLFFILHVNFVGNRKLLAGFGVLINNSKFPTVSNDATFAKDCSDGTISFLIGRNYWPAPIDALSQSKRGGVATIMRSAAHWAEDEQSPYSDW